MDKKDRDYLIANLILIVGGTLMIYVGWNDLNQARITMLCWQFALILVWNLMISYRHDVEKYESE